MEEVVAVAAALGIKMTVSVDRRLAGADKVGDHKTWRSSRRKLRPALFSLPRPYARLLIPAVRW